MRSDQVRWTETNVPQRKGERSRSGFALTRAAPALLLTLAAGGLAFLLLAWAAHQSDRVSFQRQEKLVGLVVSQLRSQVAHGHVRQCGGNYRWVKVTMDHSAAVAIWGGNTSIAGGVSSAIGSVCM
jgi:hypothetical protein